MRVCAPNEVSNREYVVVCKAADEGAEIPDEKCAGAGAGMLNTTDDVWASIDTTLNAKEALGEKYYWERERSTLSGYRHLAANKPLTTRRTRPPCTMHNSVFPTLASTLGTVCDTSTPALMNVTPATTVAPQDKGWAPAQRDNRSFALGVPNNHALQHTNAPATPALRATSFNEVLN